jgi:hypothetical protein
MHLSSSMTGAYLVIVHQTDIVPSLSISTRIGKKLSDLPFAQQSSIRFPRGVLHDLHHTR